MPERSPTLQAGSFNNYTARARVSRALTLKSSGVKLENGRCLKKADTENQVVSVAAIRGETKPSENLITTFFVIILFLRGIYLNPCCLRINQHKTESCERNTQVRMTRL